MKTFTIVYGIVATAAAAPTLFAQVNTQACLSGLVKSGQLSDADVQKFISAELSCASKASVDATFVTCAATAAVKQGLSAKALTTIVDAVQSCTVTGSVQTKRAGVNVGSVVAQAQQVAAQYVENALGISFDAALKIVQTTSQISSGSSSASGALGSLASRSPSACLSKLLGSLASDDTLNSVVAAEASCLSLGGEGPISNCITDKTGLVTTTVNKILSALKSCVPSGTSLGQLPGF